SAKTDITTVAQLSAFYADGTLPAETQAGTGLTVSLSAATPASATAIVDLTGTSGQAYVPFVSLNFAAGSDGAVKVKTIKLKRSGIPSADTDLSNVQIYDGATKIADYSSFSSGVITFNNAAGLFTVAAGSSKTITVTGNISDTVASGRNIKLGVETSADVVTDGATVNGSFPIVGNVMNVADIGANLLGTAVIATVSNGSGTEPGTTAQDLWKFKVTGANQKISLSKIKLTMIGTIAADDLQNLALYQGSTKLGATATQLDADKTVTFDLSSSPFEINKTNKDFTLKGDIVGGTNRTYQFSIQSMDDVSVTDVENGVRIKAGDADSWTVIQAAAATTISVGSLTVVKTPSVATGNVAKGALDQLLASFDFKATGEPIKITTINLEANTGMANGLHQVKLFVDGSQIGTTKDLAEDIATSVAIGNSLIIPAGTTKTVEVRGDVKNKDGVDLTADTTLAVYLSGTNSSAAGTSAVYTRTISMGSANLGGIAGSSRTIKAGALTTAINPSVAAFSASNPVGVVGATGVLVGSFVATVGAGEAVYVDDVQITDADAAFSSLQNLKVKVNGTEIGTTVTSPVTTTTYTFSANPSIEAAASANVTIQVYADIKAGTTLVSPDKVVLSKVTATGKNTSSDASDANSRNGQVLHSVNGGALAVTLNGSTPASAMLVMGSSSDVPVASYDFEETTGAEDMTITELVLHNVAGTDTNLNSFGLYEANGTTPVATKLTSASGVITFGGLSVNVAKGTKKTLVVKAKATSYPNAAAGASNFLRITASSTTDVLAEGVTSGPQTITIGATNLDGNIFKDYRTTLTAVKGTVSGDGTTGRNRSASQVVSQIKLMADSAYNAKLSAATTADALTESLTPAGTFAGTW
ncbi:MAG: hypothetical protein PHY48_17705, partial [Candidatus Cloacimonetes bacterium]|nr:hypothetical protein [Candidatus Cloacimonadota bacterium]